MMFSECSGRAASMIRDMNLFLSKDDDVDAVTGLASMAKQERPCVGSKWMMGEWTKSAGSVEMSDVTPGPLALHFESTNVLHDREDLPWVTVRAVWRSKGRSV